MKDMDLFNSVDSTKGAVVKDRGNKKYKDSFFCKLFSDKECLLNVIKFAKLIVPPVASCFWNPLPVSTKKLKNITKKH